VAVASVVPQPDYQADVVGLGFVALVACGHPPKVAAVPGSAGRDGFHAGRK
jgi:hypothetical protein